MKADFESLAASVVVLGLLLLAGRAVRALAPGRKLQFVPASVLAGLLGLALGPHVLGALAPTLGIETPRLQDGLFTAPVLQAWRQLPGVLISVVFASLFLGRDLPSPGRVWQLAGPQAAFGQALAWGQYVVGIALVLLVLEPFFGANVLSGALIEIGFQGGHGTATGLAGTFEEFGFSEGEDLALALATLGVLGALLLGLPMIHFAARSKRLRTARRDDGESGDDSSGVPAAQPERDAEQPTSHIVEAMTVQWSVIALAIGLAWLLLRGLMWIERRTWGGDDGLVLLGHMPLFPLAMIAGVLVQLSAERLGLAGQIERPLIERIGGVALDLVVAAALASLNLRVVADNWATVLLLTGAGTAWNVGAFYLLAPRMLPDHWFTRGIGDFGQSMGMTVTGLLLMRVADPRARTNAVQAFGYKQLLFEPIVGGGVMTAAAIPLIAQLGAVPVLVLCAVLCVGWALTGLLVFGRSSSGRSSRE